MRAMGIEFRRSRRPFHILPGEAGDEAIRQILKRAEAEALRCKVAAPLLVDGIDAVREIIIRENRRRAGRPVALKPRCRLNLEAMVEGELLEDEPGDGSRIGRREQAAGVARGAELGAACLKADRTRERAICEGNRHMLEFDAALDFAVLEGGADAIDAIIVEADLVMLIGRAVQPEPDRLERAALEAILALDLDLVLFGIEAGKGVGSAAARNMIDGFIMTE